MRGKYSSANIRKYNANYNIVIGERSNGKTYDSIYNGLKEHWDSGQINQFAYVRRWDEDYSKQRAFSLFQSLICNGEKKNVIAELTGGEYNNVYYYSRRWYLCRWDEELQKRIVAENPFAYAFSLSAMEHDKSTSYPLIKTIIFDEFISRDIYLKDEFILFTNVVSTICRDRTDVTIWLLGNTVNRYCPYFEELGLKKIRQQEQGTIELYTMGDPKGAHLTVAVEYCKNTEKAVKSKEGRIDLFCFDNPRLKMITQGVWEMAVYPHCPCSYTSREVLFNFFIIFKEDTLHCEVVAHNDLLFVFVHKKTTPLKDTSNDLIYTTDYNPRPNYRRRLTNPSTDIERRIYYLFQTDKVFYSDNVTGEVMRNYLIWSRTAD